MALGRDNPSLRRRGPGARAGGARRGIGAGDAHRKRPLRRCRCSTMLLLGLAPAATAMLADVAGREVLQSIFEVKPPPSMFRVGGSWLALLGWWATLPLLASARFFVYLDIRTRTEGWDIQTRFAEIAARASANARDRQRDARPSIARLPRSGRAGASSSSAPPSLATTLALALHRRRRARPVACSGRRRRRHHARRTTRSAATARAALLRRRRALPARERPSPLRRLRRRVREDARRSRPGDGAIAPRRPGSSRSSGRSHRRSCGSSSPRSSWPCSYPIVRALARARRTRRCPSPRASRRRRRTR